MQARKRAKPVKFGKEIVKPEKAEEKQAEHKPVAETPIKEEHKKAPVKAETPGHDEEKTHVDKFVEEKEKVKEVKEEEPEIEEKHHKVEAKEPKEEEKEDEEVRHAKDHVEDKEEIASTSAKAMADKAEKEEEKEPESKTEKEEEKAELESKEEEKPKEEPVKDEFPYSSKDMSFTEEKTKKKKGSNLLKDFLLVAFIAFFIGLASMAGITYILQKNNKPEDVKVTSLPLNASVSTAPINGEEKVTPTAKEVNATKYTINIFNGSGITGEAARLKDELTAEGFVVATVGNADSNDYEKTQVSSKTGVNTEFLNNLKQVLKKNYILDTAKLPKLASGEADVVITIGSASAK